MVLCRLFVTPCVADVELCLPVSTRRKWREIFPSEGGERERERETEREREKAAINNRSAFSLSTIDELGGFNSLETENQTKRLFGPSHCIYKRKPYHITIIEGKKRENSSDLTSNLLHRSHRRRCSRSHPRPTFDFSQTRVALGRLLLVLYLDLVVPL